MAKLRARTLPAADRIAIAAATQRYINAHVFRQMQQVIEGWRNEDTSRARAARLMLVLAAACALAGAAYFSVWKVERDRAREVAAYCHAGATDVREGRFADATAKLTRCVALAQVSTVEKAAALRARARAESGLLQPLRALRDIEASFELQPAASHADWFDLAYFLRRAGKPYESLAAIAVAERYQDARMRARTQYEKRLVMDQLGRTAVD